MAVVWVIEKPGRFETSLAARLQGDVAVRAFASVKNFLKLAPMSSISPDALVIRGADFKGELDNLERLIDIHWPEARVVVLGHEEPGHQKTTWIAPESEAELPFLLQRILKFEKEMEHPEGSLILDELCLDSEGHRLRVLPDGEWLHLTLKEAQILRQLMRFQDRYLSYEDLCSEIWKDIKVSPKSVSSHMTRLRKNLAGSPFTIENVYGGGYRLVHQTLSA